MSFSLCVCVVAVVVEVTDTTDRHNRQTEIKRNHFGTSVRKGNTD